MIAGLGRLSSTKRRSLSPLARLRLNADVGSRDMNDQIEIGDFGCIHRPCLLVARIALGLTILMLGLAFVSKQPVACIVTACCCAAFAGGMWLIRHFVAYSIVLTTEGICWVSDARTKVMPWKDVGVASVGCIPLTGDDRPMLLIADSVGRRTRGYGSDCLCFEMQDAA